MGSLPFFMSGRHEAREKSDDHHWSDIGMAAVVLLAISTVAGTGGLLSYLVGTPKALILIFSAMVVWLMGGWLLGGWRAVLAGLAGLAAALAASNGDYALSVGLCGLLFVFLAVHVRILPTRS
jgi:hypothetical protein